MIDLSVYVFSVAQPQPNDHGETMVILKARSPKHHVCPRIWGPDAPSWFRSKTRRLVRIHSQLLCPVGL